MKVSEPTGASPSRAELPTRCPLAERRGGPAPSVLSAFSMPIHRSLRISLTSLFDARCSAKRQAAFVFRETLPIRSGHDGDPRVLVLIKLSAFTRCLPACLSPKRQIAACDQFRKAARFECSLRANLQKWPHWHSPVSRTGLEK